MNEASPQAQKLSDARALFDQGNYKKAREIAELLVASTVSSHDVEHRLENEHDVQDQQGGEIAAAARELLSDMAPPGLTKYLLALTFTLLTAVTIFAYLK